MSDTSTSTSTSSTAPARRPRTLLIGAVVLAAVVVGAVVGAMAWWPGGDSGAETESDTAFCWDTVPGHQKADGQGPLSECGEALETAMTRKEPGASPSPGSRAFADVVTAYAEHTSEDPARMPAELRPHMARALVHHGDDVHTVLGAQEARSGSRSGSSATADVSREDLVRFVRAVSGSAGPFRTLYGAQADRAATSIGKLGREDLAETPEGSTDTARGVVDDNARVLATLTRIRAAALQQDDDGAADETALAENDEEHGKPRLTGLIEDRAKAVGLDEDAIHGSGTRCALLIQDAGRAYETEVRRTDAVLSPRS
ncbi:hypothetical protein [Streptomyces daliensis]|uniref:Uncharacterized protein n=1 Tax=Streptomyces daliensis TaxID=299421 RepID=A0A8T4IUN4_9ACTN|nr:hypothetical protein [Streptomyces daliensis]